MRSTLLLAAFATLYLAGCDDSATQSGLDEEAKKYASLQSKIALLEPQVQELQDRLKERDKTIHDLNGELNVPSKLARHTINLLADDAFARKAVLEYFKFGDVTPDLDAYNDLADLAIWTDCGHFRYWDTPSHALCIALKGARDPTILNSLWTRFQSTLFGSIDTYIYRNSKAHAYVEALLATQTLMNSQTDTASWMDEFGKSYDLNSVILAKHNTFEPLLSAFKNKFGELPQLKLVGLAEERDKTNIEYWLYSFWYRRHMEKNSEVVHRILVQIRDHYDPSTSTGSPVGQTANPSVDSLGNAQQSPP